MNQLEHRKILSLKKKSLTETIIPVVKEVPKPLIQTYVAQPLESRRKPQKKVSSVAPTKVSESLKSRLIVHTKATNDLKTAKHPMRIMCLNKMLLRLNKHLLLDNSLVVSYDDLGEQILTYTKVMYEF
jgi:hypothetical protein